MRSTRAVSGAIAACAVALCFVCGGPSTRAAAVSYEAARSTALAWAQRKDALATATRLALARNTKASFSAYDDAMHPGGPSSSVYPRGAYEDTGAEARFESGLGAGSDGRLRDARSDFASAVSASPDFAQAWLLLGVSDYLAHDVPGARRAWNNALLARGTAMPGSRPPIDPTALSALYLLLKT